MSTTIDVARVQQYKANVTHLFQQRGAKLRGTTRTTTVVGKQHFFERLGPTAAVKRTTRHTDTPLVNSQHSRRMVVLVDYEWADLVDTQDKLRLIITPESEYALNAAAALGRALDDAIITAFDADARTGEDGSTPVTFANDWPVARSGTEGDIDATAAAVGTANILDSKTMLDTQEVPEGDRFAVVSPEFMNQLLANSTLPASSSDFNTIKALVRGELDTWVGYKWITSTRLPVPAANQRYAYFWHSSAMGLAMAKELSVKIDLRIDKSYATQVYASGTWDATRVQGEGVVRMKISELN